MEFEYSGAELTPTHEGNCWLLTNGLGGYMSTSDIFSVTRCDQGLLISAESPSRRYCLLHRLSEEVVSGGAREFISSQSFAGGAAPEEGWRRLESFKMGDLPEWRYDLGSARVVRTCAMEHGANTAAVVYEVENKSDSPVTLIITPIMQFSPKGAAPQTGPELELALGERRVMGGGLRMYFSASGELEPIRRETERLYYADDDVDGRSPEGAGVRLFRVSLRVEGRSRGRLEIVFSDTPVTRSAGEIILEAAARRKSLLESSPLRDPVGRELARAADAFIAARGAAGGMTMIAGYPFFADWGRDTMIALPGCCLTTGRFREAAGILRTFLAHERDGLIPNLFPEGGAEPMYNTADAALLLINCVWLYYKYTDDKDFVREALPTLRRIVAAYREGTRHSIHMDSDGLIWAGAGDDQVTWMDVRIEGYLPTPRHGKPVEINAYWYNALKIMESLSPLAGEPGEEYGALAEMVRRSFIEKFWMGERGYLRDVLSGTAADEQFRCNQIWAVSMPFTMLPPDMERSVVEEVFRRLYTPIGLRTLSPEDPQFHPTYGGSQYDRDMAYHQGTVWPFPLGAWYISYLKVKGNSREAAAEVRARLGPMGRFLREGCAGEIAEVYDGLAPGPPKGCFAQAWSVGEILRVYEALERIEEGEKGNG